MNMLCKAFSILLISTFFSACSESKFSQGAGLVNNGESKKIPNGTGGGGSGGPHDNLSLKEGKHSWQASVERPDLDLMVAIDTSGSVAEYSDQIVDPSSPSLSERLKTLSQVISEYTNLKLILIAPKSADIRLPMHASNMHSNSYQIDKDLSRGTLIMAAVAAASCRKEATFKDESNLDKLVICNEQPTNPILPPLADGVLPVAGGLVSNGIFRTSAKRAYLIISPNEQRSFLTENFMNAFKNQKITLPPVFSIHKQSVELEKLSERTGALSFDFTQQSWSDSFTKLGKSIIAVAGLDEKVPNIENIESVKSVKLNGNSIDVECISARQNSLSFSQECIKKRGLTGQIQVDVVFNYFK